MTEIVIDLWIYWILTVIIGSIFTGFIKSISVKVHSKYRYGELIYGILDTAVSIVIGYILLSAIAGHWLK